MSAGNLILSREKGQTVNIYVGKQKISVTSLPNNKLGIRAEKDVKIMREELDAPLLSK